MSGASDENGEPLRDVLPTIPEGPSCGECSSTHTALTTTGKVESPHGKKMKGCYISAVESKRKKSTLSLSWNFKVLDTLSFSTNGLLVGSYVISFTGEEKGKDSLLGIVAPVWPSSSECLFHLLLPCPPGLIHTLLPFSEKWWDTGLLAFLLVL